MAYALTDQPRTTSTQTVGTCVISPGYVRTLGASVLAGRDLTDADRASATPVALVNQRFADMHWPGQSAVGRQLRLSSTVAQAAGGSWITVVGVVSNIAQDDRTRQAFDPLVNLPYAQHPQPNMFLFARSRNAQASVTGALRSAIVTGDPRLPVTAVQSLNDRLGREYAVERQSSSILGIFAAVALALATVGLYVVLAHTVSQRSREIGIRIALGASRRAVLGLVATRVARAATVGIVVGGVLAIGARRLVESQLVGVSAADPLTIAGALLMLGSAAVKRQGKLTPLRH